MTDLKAGASAQVGRSTRPAEPQWKTKPMHGGLPVKAGLNGPGDPTFSNIPVLCRSSC